MSNEDHGAIVAGFQTRTLTAERWNHRAHLIVCWHELVGGKTTGETLDHLRIEISGFNGSIDVPNTDNGGYHETLTRYFVCAVGYVIRTRTDDTDRLDVVLTSPICSAHAPLTHWTKEALFSVQARRGWLPPDLKPLLWE
jgi:hypothetical protein